jgi:CDP-glycerol glycerophosphotransferase
VDEQLAKALTQFDQIRLSHDVSALSKRVKKRPVVLFFGRPTFSDNTKYLYLAALARERNYEVYWCTPYDGLASQLDEAGLPCLHLQANVDLSIDTLLHAAVAVFCINPNESLGASPVLNACLDGATKLQLWHGVSVKRLSLQLIQFLGLRDVNLRQPWEFSSRADHVLSTSSRLDGFWREVFGCRSMVRAGYPRNEVLRRPASADELIGSRLDDETLRALESGKRQKLLMVPTWQRGHPTFLSEEACLVRLLRHARARGFDLFIKEHPMRANPAAAGGKRAEGLYLLPGGLDVYPWLNRFDALITDYSSLMFDFMLTGKPVMRLDLAPGEHQNFEPDYSLIPPGEFAHVYSPDTLEQTIDAALGRDGLHAEREAMAAQLFETDPLAASDRLLALIAQWVDAATADDYTVIS